MTRGVILIALLSCHLFSVVHGYRRRKPYTAPRCRHPKPLGMENGVILDSQITASSAWSSSYQASRGRLNMKAYWGKAGSWSAAFSNRLQWLQVDFTRNTVVAEIATQGRQDHNQWVKRFIVYYSNDGKRFKAYRENGWTKIFLANFDRNSVVHHSFSRPITARYIRIRPLSWHGWISMRLEFYGCRQVTPVNQWFRIYTPNYRQCLSLRDITTFHLGRRRSYRKTETVVTTRWCRRSSRLWWQWSEHGQLKARYSQKCLTIIRFPRMKVSMRPCNAANLYQQWTCVGKFLKSRAMNKYLVPIRYYNKFNGGVALRSSTTNSCEWVKYRNGKQLCDGLVTTPKPKTTLATARRTTTPQTTTRPPPQPSTPRPTPPTPKTTTPPVPPVPRTRNTVAPPTPPKPDTGIPPIPPIPPTTPKLKPPPPPSNRNVRCGTKGRVGAVVNGTRSAVGSFPWQVGIKSCADCNITCGGTLINDEWVVTAAHCVSNWFPEELYIVAGEVDQSVKSGHEQSFRCDKIIVHEGFGVVAPYDKDIALLRITDYAVYNNHVRPLCLPDNGAVLSQQDLCTVTGFGRVRQNGLKSARLLQANVKIAPFDKCKKAYLGLSPPRQVTSNMLCAGFEMGGTDACQGDSGGPLTCFDRSNARFILGGVVSWGVGCARPNLYGVYTKVAEHSSWIQNKIATQ